jgi:hypothetical protein
VLFHSVQIDARLHRGDLFCKLRPYYWHQFERFLILFAYNLEASRGASPGTVKIRIEPISARTEASILSAGAPGRPRYSGPRLPTVAGVREFPAVALGQAVTLDILHNPSTGEKIYDVLRPIAGSSSQGMSVTSVAATETISLNRITIRVNGQAIPAPASWIIGGAVRIDTPHHGTFVIAASQPQGADGHTDLRKSPRPTARS